MVDGCNDWTCASIEDSGSSEIPRFIVGLGSVREVAWDFPLRAKIADGLLLERLGLVGREGKWLYQPSSWNGLPGH